MNLIPWLILVTAYGACVGSFLNVIVYRLPEGINIVTPASSCPKCGHKLAAWDNVPVFGWLWLHGCCRYCKTAISAQYPIIEATTALLFGSVFAFFYMTDLRPQWQVGGILATWPALLVHLILLASLIAATLIDAKLFIIPLSIPRVATMTALIGLPLASLAYPQLAWIHPRTAEAIVPRTGDWSVGAAAGGMIGMILANVLVGLRVLPRSFEDAEPPTDQKTEQPTPGAFDGFGWECLFAAGLIAMGVLLWLVHRFVMLPTDQAEAGWPTVSWRSVLTVMVVGAFVIATFGITVALRRRYQVKPVQTQPASEGPDEWLAYPHPRREMLKECLFVLWPLAGFLVGAWLTSVPAAEYPAWVYVAAGCCCGYLAGAAVVWATRILGTLAFGKEAMGLGDVHLMGAVGAVLGWLDVTVAFFMAPFFGIAAFLLMRAVGRLTQTKEHVIPYGPYLAGGAVIVQIIGGREILHFLGILFV